MTENKNTKPVGLMLRIGVMFYDSLLLLTVLFFIGVAIEPALNITLENPLAPFIFYLNLLVGFLFFAWSWTHGGQTLGLKTWKLKLVSTTGKSVTWKESLLRYLASIICWLSLGLGFLWCYTNKERLAWNDLWSNTRLQRVSV